MNIAGSAQVVGESPDAIKGVEISELCVDVELQQEWHLGVFGSFPDYDSISITLAVLSLVRQRMPAVRKYLLNLSPPLGYSTRHSPPARARAGVQEAIAVRSRQALHQASAATGPSTAGSSFAALRVFEAVPGSRHSQSAIP
jgi:hypothetical protein